MSEGSQTKRSRSEGDEFMEPDIKAFLENFKGDFMKGFDQLSTRLDHQDRHNEEMKDAITNLSTKTTLAHDKAEEALKEVQKLKEDYQKNLDGDRLSEASTASAPGRTWGRNTSPPSTPFRAPSARGARGSPSFSPPQPATPQAHPANDGLTVVAGGFARDTPREELQKFATDHFKNIRGIKDIKAKYNLGSVVHMHFENSELLWDFMRNKPSITHKNSATPVWYTLPKTTEERARASALSQMRKALEHFMPAGKQVTVMWGAGLVKVNEYVVARTSPSDQAMIQVSASQLKAAGVASSASMIQEKYKDLRKLSSFGTNDVSDWR